MLRPSRLALFLGLMWGCTGNTPEKAPIADAGSRADGAVPSEECAMSSAAYCERLFTCTPDVGRATYASMDECRLEDAEQCRQQGIFGGTSANAVQSWVTCNRTLGELTCNDFRFKPVPECDPPAGMRKENATCIDDGQCATSFCRPTSPGAGGLGPCGRCAPRPELGATCDEISGCNRAACVNGRCVLYSGEGGPCEVDRNAGCLGDLVCVEGLCAKALPLGAKCSADGSCASGACRNGLCATLSTAGPGEPCSETIACLGLAFRCDVATRRCMHAPRAGEACLGSDDCAYQLVCTNGACVPLTEAMCGG